MSSIRLKLLRQNGQILDITSHVKRLKWGKMLSKPWEIIDVSLKIPFAHVAHHGDDVGASGYWSNGHKQGPRPRIGDWLAVTYYVRDEDDPKKYIERAHTACRVELSENMGMSSDDGGGINSLEVRVLAESWLSFLSKSPVMYSPDREKSAPGLFSGKDLVDAGMSLLSSLNGDDIGLVLKQILAKLGNTLVPSSVSSPQSSDTSSPAGSRLGDLVRIVHNHGTEPPGRSGTCEQVPASSIRVLEGFIPESASVMDLIVSTFQPDADMVELFTDLEVIRDSEDASSVVGKVVPVLIHRMVPFRTMTLENMVAMHSTSKKPGDPGTYEEQPRPRVTLRPPLVESMFRDLTWKELEKTSAIYSAGEVYMLASAEADGRRVNSVTINNPMQPGNVVRILEELSLPYTDVGQAELHGHRLYQPRWHFFPERVSDTDYFEWMYVIAAQAAQFHMGCEVFERGTLDVAFRIGDLAQTDSKLKPKRALRHGGAFEAMVGPGVLRGYVDGYHHLLQVFDDGSEHASTHINFSRGLYNEEYREPHTKMAFHIPYVLKQGKTVTSDDMWSSHRGIFVNGELRPTRVLVKSGVRWSMMAKGLTHAARLIDHVTSGGSLIAGKVAEQEERDLVRNGVNEYWSPTNSIRTSAQAPYSLSDCSSGTGCVDGSKNITSIVLHYTSGRQSALSLENRMIGIGSGGVIHYHFIVKLDGTVYQFADARATGWALYSGDLGAGKYSAHESVVAMEKSTIHIALETPAYEKKSELDSVDNTVDVVRDLERARSDSNIDKEDVFLSCSVINPVFVEQVNGNGNPGGLAKRFPVGLPLVQRNSLKELIATLYLSIQSHAAPGTPWYVSELVMRGRFEAAVALMNDGITRQAFTSGFEGKFSAATANTRTLTMSGTFDRRTARSSVASALMDFYQKQNLSEDRIEKARQAEAVMRRPGSYDARVVDTTERSLLLERSGVVRYSLNNGAVTGLQIKPVHNGKITNAGALSHHGNWSPNRWDAGGVDEFAIGTDAERLARSMANSNNAEFPSPVGG